MLVLDGAPLPSDASIRDFVERKADYVANAMEQVLFLPQDMIELRNLKKHEVFLSFKRDLALVKFLVPVFLFLYLLLLHVCVFHTILSPGLTTSWFFLFVRLFKHPMLLRNGWIMPWLNSRRRSQRSPWPLRPRPRLRKRPKRPSIAWLKERRLKRVQRLLWPNSKDKPKSSVVTFERQRSS